jgi:hypothetical protein
MLLLKFQSEVKRTLPDNRFVCVTIVVYKSIQDISKKSSLLINNDKNMAYF